ncbi:hybrid sensory histidine kinase BarA [compost metagenome]
MPVMDGVAATRAIRALPGPASAVPILALTANADPRDEAEYLAAGMDGVAQKPIQPDALLNAIRLALSRHAVAVAA